MILHGRLLLRGDEAPLPGWVRVAGGRIAETGRGRPPEPADAGDADSIICPGFIDAHVHLPQIRIVGYEYDDLLSWLDEVVYPAEMRWGDPAVARAEAAEAHRRMLDAGTLGYAGYLTSHRAGIDAVREAHEHLPLRAIVGQVLLDRHAPEGLLTGGPGREPVDPEGSGDVGGRLALSINPRFAVACSDTLQAEAAARVSDGRFVQTHIAESVEEVAFVRELFPEDASYAAVYDRHGLLGPRTLLAHCLHLDRAQWELIARRRCVVVHCPTANTFLSAGVFDLAAPRRHGVRLALGSDVAAGPDLAMPRVARAMIEVAKLRALAAHGPTTRIPTAAECWELITRGNAEALGFEDAGRLEPGAAADLLLLKADLEPDDRLVGRLIYTWRDEYITHRVLNGRLV